MDLSAFTTVSTQSVLFWVFSLALLIQLWYYLGYFARLTFYKEPVTEPYAPSASIIICARNEEENISKFLPLVLEQDYPNFEVVVVDDCSLDTTGFILKEFSKKYNHLKVVTIKETKHHEHGKKVAVMMGIKGASNECLLFTDADCRPNSNQWLTNMMKHFSNKETEIVLGYGGYEKEKGFLNKLIRFDTFMIAMQYLSFALAGKTYMGVGRNLAYKKSLFYKMKGFASHYHIQSGDDDLFVNEAATKHNSKIEININSQTVSEVKKTFNGWFRQKHRHIETYKFYNFKSKMRLSMLVLSQYMFFGLFVILLCLQIQPMLILSIFMFRLLIQIIVFKKPMDNFSEKDLIFIFPVIEVILLLLYPILTIVSLVLKKIKWT